MSNPSNNYWDWSNYFKYPGNDISTSLFNYIRNEGTNATDSKLKEVVFVPSVVKNVIFKYDNRIYGVLTTNMYVEIAANFENQSHNIRKNWFILWKHFIEIFVKSV